jgi:hypothetical protein
VIAAPRFVLNGPAIPHAVLRRAQRRLGLGASILGLVCLAALSSSCRGSEAGTLHDLDNIGDLKARFNRDAGKPRIVLLLSPT